MNYLIQPAGLAEGLSWYLIAGFILLYVSVRALVLQGGLYLVVTRASCAIERRIFRLGYGKDQLKKEFQAVLITLLVDSVMFATLVKYGPRSIGPGSVLISFLISFVWFEIWFYGSHRLFHNRAFYWIHEQHHVARVTSPLTAMSFSVIERVIIIVGGIGPLVLLSLIFPFAQLGLILYLIVNYLLNIYGHSNIEFIPPKMLELPLGKVLNTTSYHALHHARYRGHFGLFTPFLDRMFQTRFEDYEKVQRAAYEGHGLTSFTERLK